MRWRILAVVALPLAATGTALLASNTVAGSYAGASATPVIVPTEFTAIATAQAVGASDATYRLTGATATLGYDGTPVAGETVTFTAGGRSCTATTSADGTASCPILGLRQAPATYTVTFAGEGPLEPTSANGAIVDRVG